MNESKSWVLLMKTNEGVQAELLRGLLEGQGIQVLLSKEGAAKAIGLDAGALGEVEVLVPKARESEARQLLEEYFSGDYEEN